VCSELVFVMGPGAAMSYAYALDMSILVRGDIEVWPADLYAGKRATGAS